MGWKQEVLGEIYIKVHSQSQKLLESTLWLSIFHQINCFQWSGMYVYADLCAFGEGCAKQDNEKLLAFGAT